MTESTMEKVKGFRVAGVHAGLKPVGVLDFTLIVSDTPCAAAGVFTTNQVKAAPVLVDMAKLQKNPNGIRAVAVNTKCANACTGQQGIDNANEMARLVAEQLGCSEDDVLVMSTGVIGTQLPMDKIKRGVELSANALGDDWNSAAQGIMTTDTRPKLEQLEFYLADGQAVRITGIAKGAGMIAPNMATMLSVIVTDAVIDQQQMERIFRNANDVTFNSIAVDGDTSTNDTVLLLANGASGVVLDDQASLMQFQDSLTQLCKLLAQSVVRDGEGATKFIQITVKGTRTREDARQIANTIAISPLVKTAFYGGDANWGRILAAAGRAGVTFDQTRLSLSMSPLNEPGKGVQLIVNGEPTGYSEAEATAIIQEKEVAIELDCGDLQAIPMQNDVIVWTCDLSHDYVSINGHYRS